MNKLKNVSFIAIFALFISILFYACSKDEQIQSTAPKNNNTTNQKIAQTICDITGTTVVSSGSALVTPGTTATYTYTNNTGIPGTVVWTMSANPVGSAAITVNGNSVTVVYASNFISGTLKAAGSGGTIQTCNTVLNITSSGGNGTDCACPYTVIRCVLAVSGGHPYWRFQLDNLQAGDTFLWSQNHAPIFGSLTNNSYVIANPDGPLYSGFTIYCEVTRRCTNGTIKKRKAFYTNYYGGTTTSGTQGFINLGGICDGNLEAE